MSRQSPITKTINQVAREYAKEQKKKKLKDHINYNRPLELRKLPIKPL